MRMPKEVHVPKHEDKEGPLLEPAPFPKDLGSSMLLLLPYLWLYLREHLSYCLSLSSYCRHVPFVNMSSVYACPPVRMLSFVHILLYACPLVRMLSFVRMLPLCTHSIVYFPLSSIVWTLALSSVLLSCRYPGQPLAWPDMWDPTRHCQPAAPNLFFPPCRPPLARH